LGLPLLSHDGIWFTKFSIKCGILLKI
jgi:hypothetical protein